MLKPLGYATGQFRQEHLGDRDEFLPTMLASTSSSQSLSLNAEEERNCRTIPRIAFKKAFGPRGVLHCLSDGKAGKRSRTPAR